MSPVEWFSGGAQGATEVAIAEADARPTMSAVRDLWKDRHGKRPVTLLLVVRHPSPGGERMSICGPVGDHPPVIQDLEPAQVERLCAAALAEPDRHSAARFLAAHLPEMESELPGVRNVGMLAMHELIDGVPQRADWSAACAEGKPLLDKRGRTLVEALNFSVGVLPGTASVLTVDEHKRAVAVFLEEGETFEDSNPRFDGVSPVSKALAVADREDLPWVVLTRGRQIRLYAARPDTGVGRKGRAETFVELDLALLPESSAGYLPLLFGSEALAAGGTFEEVLEECGKFAAALGARLRERVYFEAVPPLATAIAGRAEAEAIEIDARHGEGDLLGIAYEMTMLVLFRLLFVAYAEDKDLLPYRTNSHYREHSLKSIAQRLAEFRRTGHDEFDPVATSLWAEVDQLWRAVDVGNTEWGVPAYDGGLFDEDDPDAHPAGHLLGRIELTNAEFGPALTAMLVDIDTDGIVGPVDFRSLSVREFGTIYEGLLESELSRAPSDLAIKTVKGNDTYVPAKKSDTIEVAEGQIYFHNSSGVRKSTGSYFTKPFAVEHLLDHALEPALDDHLARIAALLEEGDDLGAAEAFFDFRCVDLAMGSGHFLVAAVDRIEARLSAFLAEHPIAEVHRELEALRTAAHLALGELAVVHEIETGTLLRRQVARRCIYGIDLNKVAVELSRLAIWVHTFVEGLPLSFLDRNLIRGNALTGIGTIDEAVEILDPGRATGAVSVFADRINAFLERATDDLQRLARITEHTPDDIERSKTAHLAAVEAIRPAAELFDILVAARLSSSLDPEDPAFVELPADIDEDRVRRLFSTSPAGTVAERIEALHMPIVFPEVFLRDRPGFDCILGNPPWEKVKIEEHAWWGLHNPGLRSLGVGEMGKEIKRLRSQRADLVSEYEDAVEKTALLREVLRAGPFDTGAGDPDLYKVFAWRFWQLIAHRGVIGVVLPRAALAAAGMGAWRNEVLDSGDFLEVTTTTNTAGWVFDDAEPRYTIAFVSIQRTGQPDDMIAMRGPFASLPQYQAGQAEDPFELPATGVKEWTSGAAFPMIPGRRAGEVFLKLRAHPRLDSSGDWQIAIRQGDIHATADKKLMRSSGEGDWPVFSGAAFNIWNPDTGEHYATTDSDRVAEVLFVKRRSSAGRANSSFRSMPREWVEDRSTLPCLNPRIAYRTIGRATDSRTLIPALVPGGTVLTHKAAFLMFSAGDACDEAFLLGVLSSMPLDWYARRVVEQQLDNHVVSAFPVPRPEPSSPLRAEVVRASGLLAAVDDRYAGWAAAVGVGVAEVEDEDHRSDLVARIDAAVALLYGLALEDVATIYETFHEGADYSERHAQVAQHFAELGGMEV